MARLLGNSQGLAASRVPTLMCPDTPSCSDTSSPVSSYSWDFGDGNSDTGASVDHAYAEAGEYTVTLTIETNDGQTCETSKVVRVTTFCLEKS